MTWLLRCEWLRFLRFIGLTNLTHEQVRQY
jgi:hypothetical protein